MQSDKKKYQRLIECDELDIDLARVLIRKKGIVKGTPHEGDIRRRVWGVFLEFLPCDTTVWKERVETYTQQYQNFVNDFYYNVKFPKTEILSILQKDTPRIFPEVQFFKDEDVIEAIQRILFVNCVFNKTLQYVQGWHEICAMMYYVFSNGQSDKTESEAMTYFGFTTFVLMFRDWFDKDCDDQVFGIRDCFRGIDIVLQMIDKDFFMFLKKNQIESECYAFRWISIFFIDNFSFEDSLRIWDVLLCDFCKKSDICLTIKCVATAMAVYKRDVWMKKEPNEVLHQLMNVCPTADEILVKANKFKKNSQKFKF
ncbi:hypothetical protein EIN_172080 [Entamoeba invadens IP1]|uniref:Rab-GAP TBC domain-containing protein n=1 Tax=Entamoeba invadens IP1 TaxID=370355 RepID=A0A0A1U123_ENTIV|nr:hypothetical protein EIN_172080 [Entamoeba invadens IP1]ELP84603.1 hypothetical protein EIN_172080 [Entamoeba invadens IP1]|eukprot:XP_004183949.1 hypothetical protein EIN_172080 [Entamoeba invadens IP1]